MNKAQVKKHMREIIKELPNWDGDDIMALGMSVEGTYKEYFGSYFPLKAYNGDNAIETMAQAIINDKPYVAA